MLAVDANPLSPRAVAAVHIAACASGASPAPRAAAPSVAACRRRRIMWVPVCAVRGSQPVCRSRHERLRAGRRLVRPAGVRRPHSRRVHNRPLQHLRRLRGQRTESGGGVLRCLPGTRSERVRLLRPRLDPVLDQRRSDRGARRQDVHAVHYGAALLALALFPARDRRRLPWRSRFSRRCSRRAAWPTLATASGRSALATRGRLPPVRRCSRLTARRGGLSTSPTDLVRYERLDNRGRANPAYLCAERGVLAHAAAAGGDVVSNLAIARTGSETLALFLRALGQPSHHGHDCTLVDVAPAVRGALSSPCGTHLHGSCRASSDAWKATTSARCGTA